LRAVVDGKHVQDQVMACAPGFVDECANEAGADAAPLVIGADLDAGQVDLAGALFDVEHADVGLGGDDLPAAGLKERVWKLRWTCSSQPQIAVM
jgi:hypothetical protein